MAGLSVAFDASCEEMWLAWRNGACLVAGSGAALARMLRRGDQLATTLDEHPDILRAVDGALSASCKELFTVLHP